MEIDETLEDAAKRECLEETGLVVELGDVVGVWSYFHESKQISGIGVAFAAHVVGGEPRAGSDSLQVEFFAPEGIDDAMLAFSTHREALAKWRERQVASRNTQVSK